MITFWQEYQVVRKLAFVSANLLICAIVVVTVVMPVVATFSERDEFIAGQQRLVSRYLAVASQEDKVHAADTEASAQMQSGEFLSGANENLINAELQAKLKAIVERAGARSNTVQGLPPRTWDNVRYAGSRIDIQGSLQSVQRAIYEVESSKPYLFIQGAVIQLPAFNLTAASAQEPILQIQLDVFGAIRPPEAAP